MEATVARIEAFAHHVVFGPIESLVAFGVLICLAATAIIFFKRHLEWIGLGTVVLGVILLSREPVEPVLWGLFCTGFFLCAYGRLTRRLWRRITEVDDGVILPLHRQPPDKNLSA